MVNNDLIATGLGDLRSNWGWLLGLGLLFVILGTVGLGMSFFLTLASVLFFGALLLVGGGTQLVHLLKAGGWKCRIQHLLIALLYIAAGAVIMYDPLLASGVLTMLLAWSLVLVGVLRIVIAFQHRGIDGWWWPLLGGVLAIALGAVILAQWPVSGLWVIGLFVAIELIMNGWSYIFIALAARQAGKQQPGGTDHGAATPA